MAKRKSGREEGKDWKNKKGQRVEKFEITKVGV